MADSTTSVDSSSEWYGKYRGDFVPTQEPDILLRRFNDDAIAWATLPSKPTYLDPVARIIFEVIDGKATISEFADDMHEVIGIERQLAVQQLRRILPILEEGRLINSPQVRVAALDALNEGLLPAPNW